MNEPAYLSTNSDSYYIILFIFATAIICLVAVAIAVIVVMVKRKPDKNNASPKDPAQPDTSTK